MADLVPRDEPRTACATAAELEELLAGGVSAGERGALLEHFSRCRRCRRRLAERQDLGAPGAVSHVAPRPLRERAVAVTGKPAADRTPAALPGSARRGWTAAAAGVAGLASILGLAAWLSLSGPRETAAVRALSPAIAPPRVVTPARPGEAGFLDLAWTGTPGAAAYRLVVVDGLGEVVEQIDLDGSRRRHRLQLDALPRDRPCFWYVQALFADGTRLVSTTEALPRGPG